ncbi:MAG: hypothetical protein NZ811_05070 [Gammaproteobacteria bacterium]|nr:hypothetical protein [Gammaproteobacteria bacterium]
MLIFISSKDCIKLFPDNTAGRFRVKLANTLVVSHTDRITVADFHGYTKGVPNRGRGPKPRRKPQALLSCNLCSPAFVGGRTLPILTRIKQINQGGTWVSSLPTYANCKDISTDIIEIALVNSDGSPLNKDKVLGSFYITLKIKFNPLIWK